MPMVRDTKGEEIPKPTTPSNKAFGGFGGFRERNRERIKKALNTPIKKKATLRDKRRAKNNDERRPKNKTGFGLSSMGLYR